MLLFWTQGFVDGERILLEGLMVAIEDLILAGFDSFLFGGYGCFDRLSYSAVKKLREKYKHIKMIFVLAYYKHDSKEIKSLQEDYDEITYPEIGNKPPKFAIICRNQKMIDWADFCIFYVKWSGGANQALKYANSKKNPLLNIAGLL